MRVKLFVGVIIATLVLVGACFLFLSKKEKGWPLVCSLPETFLSTSNLYRCGVYWFDSGEAYDLRLAKKYLYASIRREDPSVEAWYQLARISFLEGDFTNALSQINFHFSVRGDAVMSAYYVRGLIYGYRKEFSLAEKDFVQFLIFKPTSWAANTDLSWVYFAQGKYEEAYKQANNGLVSNPDNPWLLNAAGVAALNLEDAEAAVSLLEKALLQAKKLEPADWSRAYPGNDPAIAERSLALFVETLGENLRLAVDKQGKPQ